MKKKQAVDQRAPYIHKILRELNRAVGNTTIITISMHGMRTMVSMMTHVGRLIILECFNLLSTKGRGKRISVATMKFATSLIIRGDLRDTVHTKAQAAVDSELTPSQYNIKLPYLKEMFKQFHTTATIERKAIAYFSMVLETIITEMFKLNLEYLKKIKMTRILPRHILMCTLSNESFFMLKENEHIIFPSSGHINSLPFSDLSIMNNNNDQQQTIDDY